MKEHLHLFPGKVALLIRSVLAIKGQGVNAVAFGSVKLRFQLMLVELLRKSKEPSTDSLLSKRTKYLLQFTRPVNPFSTIGKLFNASGRPLPQRESREIESEGHELRPKAFSFARASQVKCRSKAQFLKRDAVV